MPFLDLTRKDGVSITINSDHVITVEEGSSKEAILRTSSTKEGEAFKVRVTQTYAQVCKALAAKRL